MIEVNRGSAITLVIGAMVGEEDYVFQEGDVVRFSITEKKNENNVILRKDVTAVAGETEVEIPLLSSDTKIGDIINKKAVYWFEVELNPETEQCQTLIGYDSKGAKEFILYPESGELE